ncbi:MAG: serine hydrolase domain-containing protein [Flavobacteriales bacterium]
MKVFFFLSVFFLSSFGFSQNSDLSERLDAYMSQMNEKGLSASVICVKDGSVLLKKGYGFSNQEDKVLNTSTTVSTVGSITKQFTAAAIMKLVSQGKISVDMTLGSVFQNVPADKANITVHQLLCMSAGFVEALGDDYDKMDRTTFLESALKSKLLFEPGTSYHYSNVNYSILGAIVEIFSGKDYETYCRENLWLPAGMKNTGYVQPKWDLKQIAIGYNKRGENTGTSLDKLWDTNGPFWNLKCNGGVLSTCEDMFKWYTALQGEDILDEKMKSIMYSPSVAEDPEGHSHYGYGWSIVLTQRETRLITHNGGNGIFFADYLNYEDENTFVYVASNASKKGMQDVAWELGRMMLIPGYEPEIRQYDPVPVTLKDIQNEDYIATISNLIGFMEGRDKSTNKEFIQANLGPGLLESLPMKEHLELFTQIRKTLDGARYQDMLEAGNEFYLNFELFDGTRKQLFVELNDMGKIRGIGLPD